MHPYGESREKLLQRLKRIEGQVRGVQKMIEEDRYCGDILMQLAAIKSATQKVSLQILEGHAKGCVRKAIQSDGGEAQIDELIELVEGFLK